MRLFCSLIIGLVVTTASVRSSDISLQKLWTYPINYEDVSLPLVEGNRVYFAPGSGELHAIDLDSGETVWVNKLSSGYPVGALEVKESILYFHGSHDVFYAVDSETGELVWKKRISEGGWGSPVLFEDKVLVTGYDRSLYCLDAKNGEAFWRYRAESRLLDPLIIEGRLLLLETTGRIVYVDLRTGKPISEHQIDRDFVKVMEDAHGGIIGASRNGLISAIDLETRKIRWEFQSAGMLTIDGQAAVALDGVCLALGNYANSPSGNFTGPSSTYALDTLTGKLIWRFDASSSFTKRPAFGDRYVVMHNRNRTYYFVRRENGVKVHEIASGSSDALPPVCSGDIVLIQEGLRLIAYKL